MFLPLPLPFFDCGVSCPLSFSPFFGVDLLPLPLVVVAGRFSVPFFDCGVSCPLSFFPFFDVDLLPLPLVVVAGRFSVPLFPSNSNLDLIDVNSFDCGRCVPLPFLLLFVVDDFRFFFVPFAGELLLTSSSSMVSRDRPEFGVRFFDFVRRGFFVFGDREDGDTDGRRSCWGG